MSTTNRFAIAAMLAATMAMVGTVADAQEICRTAIASAGPSDNAGAADAAFSRLPEALETTEQEIRQILVANGFRPGAARLAQATDSCFESATLKFGIRCEARQAVCVTFGST